MEVVEVVVVQRRSIHPQLRPRVSLGGGWGVVARRLLVSLFCLCMGPEQEEEGWERRA